ncbi:MAG: tRNA threonylcarbamoyladenosine biosynthesis protein TsaE [Chloroflexi bacterium]|nr:tRNA threonylcarbamoyladenosine biosynthesis protein TsaE [Chloroflexota bacterium]
MPVIDQNSFEVISRSPDQTRRVGMRLGALLQRGDVIGLEGDLGAGKTTLVQGIASGWGSLDAVSSPTFVLVRVYRRLDGENLYHLDAYRLSGPSEAVDLDLDNMLSQGPLVVEWADRVKDALPPECLWVRMRWIAEEQHDFIFTAQGKHYQSLLDHFKQEAYGIL